MIVRSSSLSKSSEFHAKAVKVKLIRQEVRIGRIVTRTLRI